MQYTKPYTQYDSARNPAVVISKVLLPQSNITAALVHSNSSLMTGVASRLPKLNKHNIKKLNFYSVLPLRAQPLTLVLEMSNYQHTFNLSMP